MIGLAIGAGAFATGFGTGAFTTGLGWGTGAGLLTGVAPPAGFRLLWAA